MKKVISTTNAPAAIGPYSQAIEANGFVFASGQIPVNPATGEVAEGIEGQAEQVMKNMKNLLEAAGTSMENVVKTTVFIQSMDDFATINGIYSKYFEKDCPARSCVEVAKLPKGVFWGKRMLFPRLPGPICKSHGIYHDILVNYNMEKHFCFVYHREQRYTRQALCCHGCRRVFCFFEFYNGEEACRD